MMNDVWQIIFPLGDFYVSCTFYAYPMQYAYNLLHQCKACTLTAMATGDATQTTPVQIVRLQL